MTLPQVYEQFDYWADYPPARDILAAVYQVKPKRAEPAPSPNDIGSLIALSPGGFFNPDKAGSFLQPPKPTS